MATFSLRGTDTARISGGQGYIGARTIEFAGTIIVVSNIGSIRVYEGERNFFLAFVGAILGVIAIVQWGSDMGFALAGLGAVLVLVNLLIRPELMLSIGTSDGRFTNVVSTDREFLDQVCRLLQKKIDTDSQNVTGAIDLSSRQVSVDRPAA